MKHLTARPDLSVIPEPFRPVLERALEKDPQRRTPTVRKLADEFRLAFAHWQRGQRPLKVAPVPGVEEIQQAAWKDVRPSVREIPAARGNYNSGWSAPRHAERPGRDLSSHSGKSGSQVWVWLAIAVGVILLLRGEGPVNRLFPWVWFFLLVVGGLAYGTYRVVSSIVSSLLAPTPSPVRNGLGGNLPTQTLSQNYAPSETVYPAHTSPPRPARFWQWWGPETVRAIPLNERWADICTSMAWATFWTVVFTSAVVPGLAILNPNYAPLARDPGQLGLFAFTTLAGAWVLILGTKLMEGSRLRQQQRRLVLGLCGAGVGGLAWSLSKFLDIAIAGIPRKFSGLFQRVGDWPLIQNNAMTLAGFMVYFAILFAIRNWWNQTDSFRGKAFRWGSVLFTGVVAWAIPAAFAFPQDWAVGWGLALSAVVQLSAGWIPSNQRAAVLNASQSRMAADR